MKYNEREMNVKNSWEITKDLFAEGTYAFIFMCFIFIIIYITSSMEQKEEKLNPLITPEELGYETKFVNESFINSEKNAYYLTVSEKKYSLEYKDDIKFNFIIYLLENEKETNDALLNFVRNAKSYERSTASDCNGCQFYEDDNNDIFNYVYKLDEKQFNVDRIYTLYDWNNLPENACRYNYLFLQKGNLVIQVSFNNNLIIEDQTLQLFSELFDRSKSIFK